MSGTLAFSMVFKALDQASAPIRNITQALAGPAKAVGEIARAGAAAAQNFANSFAGMGAVVGAGFSLKDVAGDAEFFRRLQINSGMADAAIARLRHTFADVAATARISQDDLMGAFKAMRNNSGSVEVFEASASTLGAAIQLLGGHGEELGEMFAHLQTKMGLTKGEQFLDFLSTARVQMAGIEGGLDAFAASSQQLLADYAALGRTGLGAAKELTALYAVIARGTGNARQARGFTEGFINQLKDRGFQDKLRLWGIKVFDSGADRRANRTRSATDIMRDVAARIARSPVPSDLAAYFGPEFQKALRVPIGEIKTTGHSATLDRILSAKGDGADFMAKADQASKGLSGSLNALKNAVHRVAEKNLTGPIQMFADALSACTGPLGYVVIGLAGFAALGHVIGWITGAVHAFMAFGQVLGMIRVGALASALVGLLPALGGAIAATWAFTAALLANPITWLAIAIGAAAYLIISNWEQIGGFFSGLWEGVTAAFESFRAWIKDTFGVDIVAVATGIADAFRPLGAFLGGLSDGVSQAWAGVSGVAGKIGAAFGGQAGAAATDPALGPPGPALGPPAPTAFGTGPAEGKVGGTITIRFDGLPAGASASAASSGSFGVVLDRGLSMAGPG